MLYYIVLAIVLVAVYQPFLADLVGTDVAEWMLKANEAYLIAIVVPLFWDFVATSRTSGEITLVSRSTPGLGPVARRAIWYGAFVVTLLLFVGPLVETLTGSRLPQRIVTLRDAVVGLFGISLYFDWSRGLWRSMRGDEPRMVSGRARVIFLGLILAANIAIFLDPVGDLLGDRITDFLDFQAEGFAVMFCVPLYFDVVLRLTGRDPLRAITGRVNRFGASVLLSWIAAMAFFVWFGQGAAVDVFDNSFGQWFVRSAEPPLAAIIFTAYFELARRRRGTDWVPIGTR